MLVIKQVDIESALGNRGYYPMPAEHEPVIDDGDQDVPDLIIHETPVIHIKPPVIDNGVHDVPDLIIHETPVIDHGVHEVPDLHIPVDAIQESKYAKYLQFLPLAMLLVSEKDIIDFGRVI